MRQWMGGGRAVQAVVLAGVVVMASGCFGKGAKGDFALPEDQRRLEIPAAMVEAAAAPAGGSATAPAVVAAPAANVAANGFTVPGERDALYARVGQVLEGIDGLQIASRAQLLGSYDVAYQGENFLVRLVAVEAGVYVSAVDPRGLPANGEGAKALVARLQAALAN